MKTLNECIEKGDQPINRRVFLKMLGLATAGVALGCEGNAPYSVDYFEADNGVDEQNDIFITRCVFAERLCEAAGIPTTYTSRRFADVPEDTSCNAAFTALDDENLWISNDGMMRPNEYINRVEAIKLIAQAFELNADAICDPQIFNDVSEFDWYYSYAQAAAAHGILCEGQNNECAIPSYFGPEEIVTESWMENVLSRAQ